jgi:serpin B
MRLAHFAVAFLLTVSLVGCDATGTDGPATSPTVIPLSALGHALVAQSNAFGAELFSDVATEGGGNVMLSPLSASIALTMLLNGSDGDTFTQIRDALGYAPEQDLEAINETYRTLRENLLTADQSVQLAIANAAFYERTHLFNPSFLEAMRGAFDARVEPLDFADPASVDIVNRWANDHTNGRIPRVLEELDPDLVLLLMNALYFKGDWSTPFDTAQTRPGAFRLTNGSEVQVPIMEEKIQAVSVPGEGYAALELPYGRRNFSMVILLPDEPLHDFVQRFDGATWAEISARLGSRDEWSEVLVRLPRFSFSSDELLNDALRARGIRDAFDPFDADLTQMSDDPRLFVDIVQQNTFVAVDEKGTEAAAVTTVGVMPTSLGPHFFVDRPFVFAIRERTTNTLLFIGQVTNPTS